MYISEPSFFSKYAFRTWLFFFPFWKWHLSSRETSRVLCVVPRWYLAYHEYLSSVIRRCSAELTCLQGFGVKAGWLEGNMCVGFECSLLILCSKAYPGWLTITPRANVLCTLIFLRELFLRASETRLNSETEPVLSSIAVSHSQGGGGPSRRKKNHSCPKALPFPPCLFLHSCKWFFSFLNKKKLPLFYSVELETRFLSVVLWLKHW